MAAVAETSRGEDAGCLYGLNTQHDPGRASSLARRTGGDDDGLLRALQPVDLTFESTSRGHAVERAFHLLPNALHGTSADAALAGDLRHAELRSRKVRPRGHLCKAAISRNT